MFPRMRRRDFLKSTGIGLGLLGLSGWVRGSDSASRPPNLIFILADDFGLDDVSCYGSDRFKTPNIDALAKTGLRFENGYCLPLCGPTRCEFITGRYPFRTGGLTNQAAGQPSSKNEPSVARTLKQAGYATCQTGKWRQMGETPADWGFDEYITDPTAGGWYWKQSYTKNGKDVQLDKETYYPDVTHEFAIDFIKRNKEKPFFLYYPSHLVHGPILRTPDTKAGAADPKALYADNVAYLDKEVGDLMAVLDSLNLREQTLVVFAGDNGTAGQSGTIGGRQVHGAKGSMWEGGAHVPFLANWKGTAPAGKVLRDLVDFTDLFATFADLAGAKLPEGITFDGRSFAPQLRGQPGTPRDWIFVQLGGNWYVRERDWKLNNQGELYDMKDAPFVEKLVPADAQDEAAAAARKRLQAVLDTLNPAGGKTVPGGAGGGKPAAKTGRKAKKAPAAPAAPGTPI
jgi:arylsulfatase A-like enzyme